MTHPRRLLLDVTATESSNLKTGIQRVTLELYQWLARLHPDSDAVVPVYLKRIDDRWQHWQANAFSHRLLHKTGEPEPDCPIEPYASDTLLHLDLATMPVYLAHEQGLYASYQARGVWVSSLVYDLLPVRLPDCFPGAMQEHHRCWLNALACFDGALCISDDVANDLSSWFRDSASDVSHLAIDWFKLGYDIGTFAQNPSASKAKLRPRLRRFGTKHATTFLMVGTIEPRKGYAEALDAFDELWRQGHDCRLVIVGREGWTHLPIGERSAITEVICRLEQHPERFGKLVWLSSADDAELERAYGQADCLIAASLGEGFGLPIIEAASRGLPVIARDIAVFREVAPDATVFFNDGELAQAIRNWQPTDQPQTLFSGTTWKDSAANVLEWLNEQRKMTTKEQAVAN